MVFKYLNNSNIFREEKHLKKQQIKDFFDESLKQYEFSDNFSFAELKDYSGDVKLLIYPIIFLISVI
jgi:hypothetical protein